MIDAKVEAILKVFADLYDPDTNPNGIVNLGVADNSLCRPEMLRYFNHHRLHLAPAELTYADRFTSSLRLVKALCNLWNEYTPDWPESDSSPLPLKKVEPEHIAIASGATGILDQLFWSLCDKNDGVLLSAPYYNAFDHDLVARAETRICQVDLPLPDPQNGGYKATFAKQTIDAYELAYRRAKENGITPKVLLFCNPHNPTGVIYSRETTIELVKFAAKHKLHFVSDEIYARSWFSTTDVPDPELFVSVLSIDVEKECGLDPSYLHLVTSASKDFAVNGFRLGVLVSQSNKDLHRAMSALGLLSQSSSPAGALLYTWLEDTPFLSWYLKENRRRMSLAYSYIIDWCRHHNIPYLPSNSGFFFMIDFRRLLGIKLDTRDEKDARQKEQDFVTALIKHRVFVAPGAQYHHPIPGMFRFTFTQSPRALRAGLDRLEHALGLKDGFAASRPLLDLETGGTAPPSLLPLPSSSTLTPTDTSKAIGNVSTQTPAHKSLASRIHSQFFFDAENSQTNKHRFQRFLPHCSPSPQ
ncbi:PLP-dependent transferase [Testicularia cyperi]|uniref:PLP-dependent transferase n=1 Tax=Testicularia cyperi TaxID=1882483 RepID=A0A317XVG4_9BASI|nr:PLP-dependent transferase [Testicularia cyperi]